MFFYVGIYIDRDGDLLIPVGFSVLCSIATGFLLDHYTYTIACEAGGNSPYSCRCHVLLFARLLDLFFICTAL